MIQPQLPPRYSVVVMVQRSDVSALPDHRLLGLEIAEVRYRCEQSSLVLSLDSDVDVNPSLRRQQQERGSYDKSCSSVKPTVGQNTQSFPLHVSFSLFWPALVCEIIDIISMRAILITERPQARLTH